MKHSTFNELGNFNGVYFPFRAIFRWMTCKNMYTIGFTSAPKGSPEEVLESFKNKKGTYARIFETLCGYVTTLVTFFLDWKIFTYSEYDIVYYCIKRDNSCLQLCWVVLHGADWICQGLGLPAWGQVQRDGIQPQLERGVHRQQLVPGGLPLGHPLSHLGEKHARELGEYSILTPHYNSVSLKFSPGVKLVIILSQKCI